MKSIIVIAALALSASSFAGMPFETQSFGLYFWGSSEEEVVSMIEEAIPSVQTGDYKDLAKSMTFQRCAPIHPRHIKIGKTFIKKFYKNVDGKLSVSYRGLLTVSHNHCRPYDN
jgi:hypothetical protein